MTSEPEASSGALVDLLEGDADSTSAPDTAASISPRIAELQAEIDGLEARIIEATEQEEYELAAELDEQVIALKDELALLQ